MGDILFVDDEEVILFVAEGVFSDEGIDIITTQDPHEALEIVKSKEISVIVSDNRMPSMLGIDLLSQIQQISPETVRILMTGYADLQTALDAIEKVGAFRVIVKPWENDQLVEVIKLAINRYDLKAQLRKGDLSSAPTVFNALQLANSPLLNNEQDKALYNILINAALGDFEKYDEASQAKANSLLSESSMATINESLAGNNVPFPGRIAVIAEIFDVMTSHKQTWGSTDKESIIKTLTSMKDEVLDSDMVDLLMYMVKTAG